MSNEHTYVQEQDYLLYMFDCGVAWLKLLYTGENILFLSVTLKIMCNLNLLQDF